jgi:energy-coupling factor transporter ATP-binding protein EcfA2
MAEEELREITHRDVVLARASPWKLSETQRPAAAGGEQQEAPGNPRSVTRPLNIPLTADGVAAEFTIAFEGVTLEVRQPSLWSARRPVLQDVSGVFGPFGLHCVVCPDPAVSLHCLQVLAGIQRRLTGGCVMANAIPCASQVVRSRIGFITSIDGCVLEATVRDNLTFCVNMRVVPSSGSTVEELVDHVAQIVELDAPDLMDGLVDSLTKGQRLRLAIAMELVLGPAAIMIADPLPLLLQGELPQFLRVLRRIENSSGLQQPTQHHRQQRCLVLVSSAHLPYLFYEALDTLLLLSASGLAAFQGNRGDCVAFLSVILQQRSTPATGAADASVTFRGRTLEERETLLAAERLEVLSRGEAIADLMVQWEMEGEMGHVVNAYNASSWRHASLEVIRRYKDSVDMIGGNQAMTRVLRRHKTPRAVTRMLLLLRYTVRRALFKPDFIFAWVGLFVTFFLLAALSNRQGADQNGMQNKRGIIFFLLSCVTHVNSIFIEAEVFEYRSFVHLRNNQYFSVPEYFAATIARVAIPRIIFSVIGALFSSFIFAFALPLAVLLGLVSFTHHVLLLLLTFWWPSPKLLTKISLVYYAYSVMFSGFLICLSSVPGFLSDISVLRRAYGGALAHELRDRPYSCDAQVVPNITLAMSYCYTGNQYLQMEGFDGDSWGRSCAVLGVALSILLALVAFSMKISWVSK